MKKEEKIECKQKARDCIEAAQKTMKFNQASRVAI